VNKYKIGYHTLIKFLKALGKPIEILNCSCYGALGTYINELPKGSYIIDVGNHLVNENNMIHIMYSFLPFQEYLYGNGIDFYQILAVYQLFNTTSTNDKPKISSMNCNYDIDIDIKDLHITIMSDILKNEFFKHLYRYRIITDEMLSCMIYVLGFNKTNFSFSYTFAQFLLEMKEADFPNNIVKEFSEYYSPKLKITLFDKVNLNKILLDREIKDMTKYINPFMYFFNDFNVRDVCVPLYSYQKFLVVVNKYIK
jgi:hypothetical protein